MNRALSCLRLLLLLVSCPLALPASAAATAAISYAELPVRLVRDTTLYLAARGAHLQHGDMLESGASGIQLEGVGGSAVALGPASRVYLKLGADSAELVLLDGWMKIREGSTIVSTGAVRLNSTGSTVILHARAGKTELFIETGEPPVSEMQGGKFLLTTRMKREQYAIRTGKAPLKVLPRPPKDFLGAMPPAFYDALVAVSFKGAATAPKIEGKASFAEVGPWLAGEPDLYQALYRRFFPPKRTPAQPKVRPVNPVY